MSSRRSRKRLLPSLLPVLVTSNRVLLPGASVVLQVSDPRGMNLVESHLWNEDNWRGRYVGVVPRQDRSDKLHSIGTAASVSRVTAHSYPQPHFSLLATGLCRFRVERVEQEVPYPVAAITQLDYIPSLDDPLPRELEALADSFRASAQELLGLLQDHTPSAGRLKQLLDSLPVQSLPDLLTSLVRASYEERLSVLDAVELKDRFRLAQPLLLRQIETLRLLQNPSLHSSREQAGRTMLVRKPTPLKKLLNLTDQKGWQGEGEEEEEEEDDVSELQRRVHTAKLPTHARKAALKEIKRLKTLPAHFPEHAVSRTYLETVLDLPWSESTVDQLDIKKARLQLDADHYGMEKVKNRIVEFLAVRQLKNSLKGPILCLVGAPGVGKTSIGRSVAHTMGRKFHRISLGGVSDQSDIRGHRRTYIGSMPGRIVNGLRAVQVTNPVFLLDEVDKLSKGVHGDPAAALLEVLDPEQNHSFTDHYLNIPYDLSQVLFIATANTTSTIPPALLDRMEVISMPGYTLEEKVEIASQHLLPKQMEQHGLTASQLILPSSTLKIIAADYTREAGVRSLERNIASVCRAVAVKVAENQEDSIHKLPLPITVNEETLEEMLGPKKFEHELSQRLTQAGVAVGLAWTAMGGEILFVEATKMPGSGELVLTGQLGNVMKESARIALNWLRSNASTYGLECSSMDKTDIHIHFPAGAVEKDGPSAGITITIVLASLFSGRCVRSDTAMTGEVTLRGTVLPVGGVKEKVLAAHRAGISHVILPERNSKDLLELPEAVKSTMEFTLVQTVKEVLQSAFEGGLALHSKL